MFGLTHDSCYKKFLKDWENQNFGSALKWIEKACEKTNHLNDDYRYYRAMTLFQLDQEEECFKELDHLIKKEHTPSLNAAQRILGEYAYHYYQNDEYEDCERTLVHILSDPFQIEAELLYLLGMCQLRQNNLEDGWYNIETSAEMGEELAIEMMNKRKTNVNEEETLYNTAKKFGKRYEKAAVSGIVMAAAKGAFQVLTGIDLGDGGGYE